MNKKADESVVETQTDTGVSRRTLLKAGALSGLGGISALMSWPVLAQTKRPSEAVSKSIPATGLAKMYNWGNYQEILARIKAPVFPARDVLITDHGAATSAADNTQAIQAAIDACHKAGGGRVVVPAGVFMTAALTLKSHVNLHISEGATLKFLTDPSKYPVVFTRWESIECMNYSPLIYAYEQENIAITGKGMLDGSASMENWWDWKASKQRTGQKKTVEWGEKNVPVAQRVLGDGNYLRPNFIQPIRCRNILIEDVQIKDSPMWEINPVLSSNITVRGVSINSHGPNNDGCDPECCRDVLIENCTFDTGDDCIAIKSGRNNDGRRVNTPSENIIVRNCTMKDGHGGVVIGSEISGGCRNVFIEHCNMDSPNLDRALRFKSNAVRGGVIENIYMRNVKVGKVGEAILTVDFTYEEGAKGDFPPVLRNVQIENVSSQASPRVMMIMSFEKAVVDQIKFKNCVFKGVEATEIVSFAGTIEFQNVDIIPAKAVRSLSTRPAYTD